MPTDVVMPQMGESIAEGTIVRWIKKLGDAVERDEPLFEISTDKVDAEIPSPAAGVLTEIRVKEGETVPVDSVVAVIGPVEQKPADSAPAPPPASAAPPKATPPSAAPAATATPAAGAETPREEIPPVGPPQSSSAAAPSPPESATPPPPPPDRPEAVPANPVPATGSVEERLHQRSSPLVRKIAKDHNVDITKIKGTGISGRVTRDDILDFMAHSGSGSAESGPASASAAGSTPARDSAPPPRQAAPAAGAALPGQVQPMSVMRRKIAEHMVMSRRTSAHVHSVFEVSFARVARVREAKKAEYEKAGAKLTYMSFIIKAVADALRAVPVVNASIDGDNVVYHRDVNIGIAVALDWGLIVPVIKTADERDLLDISRAVVDLANRARAKQLKPDEVSGGTFTITNPGVFGALSGTPIINQPQVAILGVGAIEKRPVVIDDAIAIRLMAYLTLGYDHRLIDGAVADQFMSHLKHRLESWE
jgi:pyruvate dehydrogenase E2 component (dihydrolipoamide acetyltransferase)